MPSTVIDSEIFRNLYGTQAMRAVFADEALLQRYLDVEAALARVQARLGIIPQEAADEITAKAKFEHLDFDAYKRGVERVFYPILPLVEGIVAACREAVGPDMTMMVDVLYCWSDWKNALNVFSKLEESDKDAFKERCQRIREDGAYVDKGENDNIIVQNLTVSPNAVGIFGYSYLEENRDRLVGVPIAPGSSTGSSPPTSREPATHRISSAPAATAVTSPRSVQGSQRSTGAR